MTQYMLTTVDNPYDPVTRWDEWYQYDMSHGYHTPSYLARVCHSSDELSDEDQRAAIQDAIYEIVRENVNGLYKRVAVPDFNPESSETD